MSEKNQHWGSTLDDFLKEEGIYEAAKAEAVSRTIRPKQHVLTLSGVLYRFKE